MTTREWTKILKDNPAISQIKVKGEFVKGTITITRHRILENEKNIYSYDNNLVKNLRESEIDVIFDGKVKSSMGNWYPPKDYSKRHLNNWFRRHKTIREELKMRLKLIGGSSEYKIKTITCL
jgi:bacillopeptidase F (M6 metalloprotease family)